MSDEYLRVLREEIARLAAEADIPPDLLDGPTSAEVFAAQP